MKLITWNLNHRMRPKLIPDLVPEAIRALGPDLIVLTEYVRGPSHDSFIARLFDKSYYRIIFRYICEDVHAFVFFHDEKSILISGLRV